MTNCNGAAALGLLEQAGQFPNYPNVWWLGDNQEYAGNFKIKDAGKTISLENGYYGYKVTLSSSATEVYFDASALSFSEGDCVRIKVIFITPASGSFLLTFYSNITFADFAEPETSRWKNGKVYMIEFISSDRGQNWLGMEVEEY